LTCDSGAAAQAPPHPDRISVRAEHDGGVQPTELPIVRAPIAGGASTLALAAAVANAGGLGFVAGGYLTADALRVAIISTRAEVVTSIARG
jgi:hypothetical protein